MKQLLMTEQQAQILWNIIMKFKAEDVLPAIDILRSLPAQPAPSPDQIKMEEVA